MLPGSASASSRAAILTPSPKMSPPSAMMSPRLIPMRMAMRCSFAKPRFFSRHRLAQGGGAARRLDDAVELDQREIAGLLEDLSAEFGAQRLDDFGQNRPQPGEALGLVPGKQPAVAGDEDCRKPAPDARSCLRTR